MACTISTLKLSNLDEIMFKRFFFVVVAEKNFTMQELTDYVRLLNLMTRLDFDSFPAH